MLAAAPRLARDEAGTASPGSIPCRLKEVWHLAGSGTHPVPSAVTGTCRQGGPKQMAEAYCVKCKAKREVKNPTKIVMKNGKPALKGVCPVCGTNVFKIGG